MAAKDATIFVVVLSYNGLADTRKCLTSLHGALRPGVTPLLVDNGSTDGTREAVSREFPWCPVLRVEINQGPAGGNNAGIKAGLDAGAGWIVLLNNDTTVHADLFDRLREAAEAHPTYSVLGPVIKFMDDPDVVMTDGCLFNVPRTYGFFLRKEVPLTEQRPPAVTEVDIVNGCCMMIRADTLRRVGIFDESLFMYHDELDLCLRVVEAGERLGVFDHALVWHKGSATSAATGKKSIRYLDARNLWYVLRMRRRTIGEHRGRVASTVAYFRYEYYWYCAERSTNNRACANAVTDGINDALLGRTGRYAPRSRPLSGMLRLVFAALHTVHSSLSRHSAAPSKS